MPVYSNAIGLKNQNLNIFVFFKKIVENIKIYLNLGVSNYM